MDLLAASAPSVGHCNVMGTALSMNCLAEALGMALPGTAQIPGPYRERGQAAHAAGKRIVAMVEEEPSNVDAQARQVPQAASRAPQGRCA
jgi:dihydroxy-acid dehydratase